jgi:hypothetical protein
MALKIYRAQNLRDRRGAEEVTQNAFLEIYRSVAQFNPANGTLKMQGQCRDRSSFTHSGKVAVQLAEFTPTGSPPSPARAGSRIFSHTAASHMVRQDLAAGRN